MPSCLKLSCSNLVNNAAGILSFLSPSSALWDASEITSSSSAADGTSSEEAKGSGSEFASEAGDNEGRADIRAGFLKVEGSFALERGLGVEAVDFRADVLVDFRFVIFLPGVVEGRGALKGLGGIFEDLGLWWRDWEVRVREEGDVAVL